MQDVQHYTWVGCCGICAIARIHTAPVLTIMFFTELIYCQLRYQTTCVMKVIPICNDDSTCGIMDVLCSRDIAALWFRGAMVPANRKVTAGT